MTETKKFQVGDSASFTKTVTETDVVLFAGISGDLNPAHINEEAMKDSMFKGRIAHGILGVSFISAVLGMQLPGPGTIYLGQEVKFLKPIRINDTVTATLTVKEIDAKGRMILDSTVTNQNGDVVIVGESKVIPPK